MSIQTTPIPITGTVASRPRKESLYDSEGHNNAVAITNLTLFRNAANFATVGLTEVKTFGRDTNLTGAGGSLPKAHHFYLFGLRAKVRALNVNLGTAANQVTFEEVHRIRELGTLIFNFGTTPYITAPYDEIPSGVGAQFVTGAPAVAADRVFMPLSNGVPLRSNYYDVTVFNPGTQKPAPQEISEIEQFSVQLNFNAVALPSPTVELYHQVILVGVYLKGITG